MVKPNPSFILALLFGLLILSTARWARADDPNRVGLVVVHGDGSVVKQCLDFSEDELTGLDLLERSGLDLNYEADGLGATICRVDGEGCTYPQEQCFCQCQGNDCIFWSYWYLENGDWTFSNQGAALRTVGNGEVEGWVWGLGSIGGSASPPPRLSFAEVCLPAQPTAIPTNTPEPKPTKTPRPEPTPVIHYFNAERLTINRGESVRLSWNLDGAEAAYLVYEGREEGVVAPGEKVVSPQQTTDYELLAVNDDDETALVRLTITVNEATITPTPTPIPTQTPTLAQPTAAALSPTATHTPTEMAAPAAQSVAEAALPTPTATPTALPSATLSPTATVVRQLTARPLPTFTPLPAIAQVEATATRPARPGERTTVGSGSAGSSTGLLLAGAGLALCVFGVLPLLLLGGGGLIWWLKGRQ